MMRCIMARSWLTVFMLIVCLHGSRSRPDRESYRLLRTLPNTPEQHGFLQKLVEERQIQYWKHTTSEDGLVDLNVHRDAVDDVIEKIRDAGMSVSVSSSDVERERVIREQFEDGREQHRSTTDDFDYGKYHTMDEIYAWMANLTSGQRIISTVFNITHSFEGRPLMGIRLALPSMIARPMMWVQGGVHGREWISPATILYIVNQMLEKFKARDPTVCRALDEFDWVFLPVMNPDSYVYTWTTDRTWMKTRTKYNNSRCVGADPNRNYDFEWCADGGSKDPCFDESCGPAPFSEREVAGVAGWVSRSRRIRGFVDLQSFQQQWMSPWGYKMDKPADFEIQDAGSMAAIAALEKVRGTKYDHGQFAELTYIHSGSSTDWAYGKAGIKFSYIVHLGDSRHGYLTPPAEIIPSGEETLQGLMALAHFIFRN